MEHLGQFITNHWSLWLALAVIVVLIFINESITQKKKAKELSPQMVVDLINNENAIVIDLRDKETYKAGHIIDAVHANVDDFSQPKMNKYKTKTLVLVCTRGQQSATAANTLRTQGYEPVVLAGGMEAWVGADMPLVKGKG